MSRVIVTVILVVAVYALFWLHPAAIAPATDWIDDAWILMVTATTTLASLVMLVSRTRNAWTWRALGLLLMSLAAASLWGGVLYSRHDADPTPRIPETWVDLVRTFYIVGSPMLLWGLLVWLREWWPSRRDATAEELEVSWWDGTMGISDNARRSIRCAAQVAVAGVIHESLERSDVYTVMGWWEFVVVAMYAGISNMIWNTVEDGIGMRFFGPLDHRLGDAVIEERGR